jgi:dienelactone hydrolase
MSGNCSLTCARSGVHHRRDVPTLPPTVHERLARCAEQVFADGISTGATVELHIDNAVFPVNGTGQGHTFTVPPLTPGAVVRARQDAGAGFSAFSPAVTVEDAFVPPQASPSLPEEIGECSHCVFVSHATPGARLEVFAVNNPVGQGVANYRGEACISVDLRRARAGATLTARQIVCGAAGPLAARTLVALPHLPRPVLGDPLFGCQRRIPVSGTRAGAQLTFETDEGENLGTVCSCWRDVNVFVIRPLIVGEHVRARCFYSTFSESCFQFGTPSDWHTVVAPDEHIKPEILEPLIEGDQIIRVSNQIAGASLMIRIALAQGLPVEEFGPRPTSVEQEIALGAPLAAGNIVSVVQTLCGVAVESDVVTVLPKPPVVLAPVIAPPLYMCAQAVQVSNLHPGALVRVFMEGVPIGLRWAGLQSSITVPVAPALVAGRRVTAIQSVGGTQGPPSDPVNVVRFSDLLPPRLLGPIAVGDTEAWVSCVTPGAHVSIVSGGSIIGEIDAAEPVVRVPIGPLVSPFLTGATPRLRLCDLTVTGNPETAVVSPSATPAGAIAETALDFGDFDVPAVVDGGGFTVHLRAQLYSPAQAMEQKAPFVIIAHGWHQGYNPITGDPVESFKGYDYLAQHLARWGFFVFSVDLQQVNDVSFSTRQQQFARAEIILQVISLLRSSSIFDRLINTSRIGLVGHSMGGEAVVVAQHLNVTESRGFGIQGVVSIAPTRWHPEIVMPAGRYMQLFGSLDQLTTFINPSDVPLASGGMRFYDRAERDKTLFWLYGMRHNPFNSLWVAAGDFAEGHIADLALPEAEHQRVAKCLINAFFQDALFHRVQYRGYMDGTVFPQSVRHLEIHTSHSGHPRVVVDNFGDADTQAGLAAEAPLNKTINSRGQAANASGAGLGVWEDEQHSTIPHSPHSTAGLRLSWTAPAEYRTDTAGIVGSPEDVIALRLAQFLDDPALNPVAMPADLFVVLSDGTQEAAVRLGAVAQIPYPDASAVPLSMMRTVRLPIDAFRAVNPALNVLNIQSVRLGLTARPTGHILGDDFEFSA